MPSNQFCDHVSGSKMFMSSWKGTDSEPGNLHPVSAYRPQMMQGQYPTQQQRDDNFNWHVNNYRNMRDEWNAMARGQGSQSRDDPNDRPEMRHMQGPIHFGTQGMQSNAGSSQLKDGMMARFDQSNHNIGSEAGHVTRMRSQYPSCQYMEDSLLPAVRTYPSTNPYAGSIAWDDGSFHNPDRQSMNNFSLHHLSKNIPSSNNHSWNLAHTGSSSNMPMKAGQQKHGMDRRHGSTSIDSGFPSSQCSPNPSRREFGKSFQLQQPSQKEPSSPCSPDRSGCEFGRSTQLQQPSHQKQLPTDQTQSVFPVAEAEPNESAPNIMEAINNPQRDGVHLCELSLDDSFESVWTKLTVDQPNESDPPRSQLESPHHDPSMIPNAAVSGMPANTDQQTQAMNPPCHQSNGDSASTSVRDEASTSCSIQLNPDPSTVDVSQDGSSKQLPNSPCLDREIQSSSSLPGIGSFLQPVPQQSNLPQQSPVVPDPSINPVVAAAAQKVVRPKTSCGE